LTLLWILLPATLLMVAACSQEVIEPPAELTAVEGYMVDPEALARGQALFTGTCADTCHTFEPAVTDATFLFDCVWQQSLDDETIAETIKSGIPNTRMVGFGSNFPGGEEDLWKLIAYLRSNPQQCD